MATVAKLAAPAESHVLEELRDGALNPMTLIRNLSNQLTSSQIREAMWQLLIGEQIELTADGKLQLSESLRTTPKLRRR